MGHLVFASNNNNMLVLVLLFLPQQFSLFYLLVSKVFKTWLNLKMAFLTTIYYIHAQ